MGNSTSIQKTLKVSSITKNISETEIKNDQTVEASTIQISDQTVEFGPGSYTKGCNISIIQNADLDIKTSTALDVNSIVDSQVAVASDLKVNANTYVDNQTESLSTSWGNKTKLKEDISQEIENITKNVFKKTNVQQVMNKAIQITSQKVTFGGVVICDDNGNIAVEQNVAAKIVLDTLLKDVTDQMLKSDVYNEMGLDSESGAKSKDTGILGDAGRAISGIVGSIGDIVGGPLMSFVIFAGIALVVALGVFLMLGQSPAGQNAIRTAAGGGGGMPTEF